MGRREQRKLWMKRSKLQMAPHRSLTELIITEVVVDTGVGPASIRACAVIQGFPLDRVDPQ